MKKISDLLILFGVVTFVSAVEITFQVNMDEVEEISINGVHIVGGFQDDWDPATIELLDENDDGIYDVTLELIPNDTHEYKYINGNTWDGEEFGYGINRTLIVPNEDTVLEIVYFADEGPQENIEQNVTVTFQVDMSMLDVGWFSNGVAIQGDIVPLDWEVGSNLLFDLNEDLIFTTDVLFPEGSLKNVNFKFTRCDADDNWEWEYINNRTFNIDDTSPTQILDVVYFNNLDPSAYLSQDVIATINVDVSDSVNAGSVFNFLGINGNISPLDWDFTAVNNPLTEIENNIWTIDITFLQGSSKFLEFKFAHDGNDWEAGFEDNHQVTIDDSNTIQIINCIYGDMGSLSINDWNNMPNSIIILQNYPNPFNPTTRITYSLSSKNLKNSIIAIYNIKGQKIKQYSLIPNQTSIIWRAENQASGVYFYKLLIDNKIIATQKMILLK